MKPKIWGPKAWFFIHAIALNYPKNPTFQQKREYSNFFKSLKYVLPCDACAKNYGINIEKYPIDNYLDTTETLFNWTVDLHNMVNYETGKPQISYIDAYNLHMEKYDVNYKENKDDIEIDIQNKKIIKEINNQNSIDIMKQATFYKSIIVILLIIIVLLYISKKDLF